MIQVRDLFYVHSKINRSGHIIIYLYSLLLMCHYFMKLWQVYTLTVKTVLCKMDRQCLNYLYGSSFLFHVWSFLLGLGLLDHESAVTAHLHFIPALASPSACHHYECLLKCGIDQRALLYLSAFPHTSHSSSRPDGKGFIVSNTT